MWLKISEIMLGYMDRPPYLSGIKRGNVSLSNLKLKI
jgi:hypothetical protein